LRLIIEAEAGLSNLSSRGFEEYIRRLSLFGYAPNYELRVGILYYLRQSMKGRRALLSDGNDNDYDINMTNIQ